MRKSFLIFSLFFLALFAIKMAPIFGKPLTEKYLRYNDVRGVTVEINGRTHTLNFKQQNALISKVNEAIALKTPDAIKSSAKVYVHRFNAPDLVFETDIDLKQVVLFVPEWELYPLVTPYDLSTLQ